jgi:cation transport regulator ChaB
MQPHAIQVQDTETEVDKDVTDDKTGPEKKNFEQNKKAQQEAIKKLKEYYEAPYKTTKDLPDSVKVLPSEGQKLWLKVFNETYKSSDGDEVKARKVAWEVVKENYEKDKKGNWVEKKS